jgi:hypothetical protein
MVKHCKHEGCKKQPTFNFEGQKQAIYCGTHKEGGMIILHAKTCKHEGCKKRPNFNFEGEKQAIYCGTHKQQGMINIIDKTCKYEGCKKQPSFNFEGEKQAIYCVTHKEDGMIDIKHKTCNFEGCKTIPSFNFEGQKIAIYCGNHKEEGMIDIKNKTCKYDWCLTIVSNEKYEGYCLRCFIHTFPDKPVSRNYKTKEFAVVEYIKQSFQALKWIADKTVQGGCSKRRPDLFLDLGTQIIMIEIDENQHQAYDCSCQNKRTMQLSQDVGHVPIVFIRFNPDKYLIQECMVSSCWGLNKNGLSVIKKSKREEWDNRLKDLKSQIEYWLKNQTDKLVEIVELFYDV